MRTLNGGGTVRRTWWVIALIALASGMASGTVRYWLGLASYEEIDARRYARARRTDNLDIAVVYADGEQALFNGLSLAFTGPDPGVERGSVSLHGRRLPVSLHPYRSRAGADAVNEQVAFARTIARDDRYVAVVGHSSSEVALMASVSYEATKLLFMATTSTYPALTDRGFAYTIRNIVTDQRYSAAIARLCTQLHVSRLGMFYQQSASSLSAIDDFEEALADRSISTVFEKSYDGRLGTGVGTVVERDRQERLREAMAREERLEGDELPQMIAIIGDNVPAAVEVWKRINISRLRDLPLVVYGDLDASGFIDQTHRVPSSTASETHARPDLIEVEDFDREDGDSLKIKREDPGAIYVASLFSTAEASEVVTETDEAKRKLATDRIGKIQQFEASYTRRFRNTTGQPLAADTLAIQGFAMGEILKQAFEKSESVAPVDVVGTLKSRLNTFETLGRRFTFDFKGDVNVERLGAGHALLFKRYARAATP
jgi:hypothetical protein